MTTRYGSYLTSVVSVLGLLALPGVAMAQGTTSHQTVYTTSMAELAGKVSTAKSILPLIDPKLLPPTSLLLHNARPLGAPAAGAFSDGSVARPRTLVPDAYGTYSPVGIAPYTTAGAYSVYGGPGPTVAAIPVTSYPWRATGKLFFTIGNQEYVCSGSLIAPGLVVTAAHCVYDFGTNSGAGWHSNYVFYPGLSGQNVLGSWTAAQEWIPSVYYNGTDNCYYAGVACNNDMAIIVMNPNGTGLLPGTRTSWYGYGWNGYSYLTSFGNAFLASITQLGYPQAFDGGLDMERTDGIGALWNPTSGFYNTVLGTAMTGGSSGGPWLVNFGAPPSIDSTASLGNASNPNIVMGVTSWGYTSVGTNTQGASYFGQNAQFPGTYTDSHGVYRGAGNIGSLVSSACSAAFDHC